MCRTGSHRPSRSIKKLGLAFNEVSFDARGNPVVDRTSRIGFYDVINGLPLFAHMAQCEA